MMRNYVKKIPNRSVDKNKDQMTMMIVKKK